ncbi:MULTISPECIES: hypothetical protein [unclassified Legionella]|uniref:hypothetical protein n=1 Tax=unclassified Legionella TaxID=2622702 RepID=UPI0010555E52|nr:MULTISPECIES: hypothetical protein [unclassified Legionella]MDI9817983.1 hypothetical protein [Legionella sp. PL877]
MTYEQLIAWIKALEKSNPENKSLQAQTRRIQAILQKPFNNSTLDTINTCLQSLIEIDASEAKITYPPEKSAGMIFETLRKRSEQLQFQQSYPESPQSPKSKEIVTHSEESDEEKRPVALLDVDHTLLFDTEFNETLLTSLKKNGINDIYLFTDMRFGRLTVKDRMDLVERLEKKGFKVHGVITPVDLVWSQLSADNAKAFDEASRRFKGRFQGEAFNGFLNENIAKLPFLENVSKYAPESNVPGASYRDAVTAYQSMPTTAKEDDPLPGDMLIRSSFAKVFADHLAERKGYVDLKAETTEGKGHTKGLMLDFFLHHKPDWISRIIIADDNKGVIGAVKKYKETHTELPITAIEVTSFNMDVSFYDKHMDEHSSVGTKKFNDEFVDDIEVIKSQIDRQIKKLEHSKYNLFLSSPKAKIESLKLLKNFLDAPNEWAPEATTIGELINTWKSSEAFENTQTHTRVSTNTVLTQHRNLFFSEHRTKSTSTQDFVDNLSRDHGDKEIYEQSTKHQIS